MGEPKEFLIHSSAENLITVQLGKKGLKEGEDGFNTPKNKLIFNLMGRCDEKSKKNEHFPQDFCWQGIKLGKMVDCRACYCYFDLMLLLSLESPAFLQCFQGFLEKAQSFKLLVQTRRYNGRGLHLCLLSSH